MHARQSADRERAAFIPIVDGLPIPRRYAAIVAGCMNTIGNLGSAATGYITGTILQAQSEETMLRGYHINFVIFAAAYVVAMLLWLVIDSTKPVIPDDKPIAASG